MSGYYSVYENKTGSWPHTANYGNTASYTAAFVQPAYGPGAGKLLTVQS